MQQRSATPETAAGGAPAPPTAAPTTAGAAMTAPPVAAAPAAAGAAPVAPPAAVTKSPAEGSQLDARTQLRELMQSQRGL